jgi:hypothetical protein
MHIEMGDSFLWFTAAAATDAGKLRPLVRVKGAQSRRAGRWQMEDL